MKKTLTANISGTVFHIEEDAYDALQRYLTELRVQFNGAAGGEEIMADIEARIAELFTDRIKDRSMVVTMADVDHVIAVMGRPEDFNDTDGVGAEAADTRQRKYRRLFRDPDDRWLGGVLSGLAAYAGVDPLWFRLVFILLIILGVGSPILIYIILWILIPVANTTADRLMMEGEPVTVDTLKKAFKDGGQRVAAEVEDMGRRWDREAPRAASAFRAGARRTAGAASPVLMRLIGLVLVVIGVSVGLSLLGAVIGGSIFTFIASPAEDLGLFDLAAITFQTPGHATWGMIALLVVLAIPVVGLLIAGFQLLLDLKAPRWLGWSLTAVWILALAVVSWITIHLVNDLRRTEPLRTELVLDPPAGNMLFLRQFETGPSSAVPGYTYKGRFDDGIDGLRIDVDSVQAAWADLDVRRSPDAQYHLLIERRTQGASRNISLRRSDHITARWQQTDSILQLSPWLSWPKTDLFRGQRIKFIVLVPEGGAVYFDESVKYMLDDVQNVTRTYDRLMVGKTWVMTAKGLQSPDLIEPVDEVPLQVPEEPKGPVEVTPQSELTTGRGNRAGGSAHAAHFTFKMPDLLTLLRPRF